LGAKAEADTRHKAETVAEIFMVVDVDSVKMRDGKPVIGLQKERMNGTSGKNDTTTKQHTYVRFIVKGFFLFVALAFSFCIHTYECGIG
jgi:hypothetical protein